MSKIHVLDSETIDKIAAGEVVERPSSVIKELVENAIDAGADAITVEAKEGGIEFIRVTDNGLGIERDQIRTAFLRHATSKIETAQDLTRISSLGFRGEALSSIAAVSKTEVITKRREELTGTRVLLEGAVEKAFEEVGAPDGTTFIVRNLFYNTPVRRKFLKQQATEGSYIADLMEHMALSRPDISFKLILGNQTRFSTSGNGDLREVIYRIYGREVASSLVSVQKEGNGFKVEGYLGKPVMVRSNRNFEIYFINGRYIKSNIIARAVEEGYKEYLMQHKFPFCVLHITMDTSVVDVNVHPTKMDVRFSDTMTFVNFLTEAVRSGLKQREMIPEAVLGKDSKADGAGDVNAGNVASKASPELFETKRSAAYKVMEESVYHAEKVPVKQDFKKNPVWSRIYIDSNEEKNIPADRLKRPVAIPKTAAASEDEFFVEAEPIQEKLQESIQETAPKEEQLQIHNHADKTADVTEDTIEIGETRQLELFEDRVLSEQNRVRYQVIGQVFDTYWLIQFEDKLFIIDQHAAHEKVKYERLMKQYQQKAIVSQTLLPPVIVSLSSQEEAVFTEYREQFETMGFEVEAFGGNEYALRSVPADLYGCSEKEMFLEVLDELADTGMRGSFKVVEEKIASMSCKAAVKGNRKLSMAEAEALIDELLTLDNPYNCPHGRPTIISMSKEEMEKKFKRIV